MFRREGELWTVAFEGQSVRLTDVKGFADLAQLLAHPGIEVHCLELADRPAENAGPDDVLDSRARREIQGRARELEREIDEADASHDLGRAERAREELDRLVDTLSGALGLGGRSRGLGSPAERARSTVTWRIRSAIKKIAAVHPRLGRHLENAVRTGTFCAYTPRHPSTGSSDDPSIGIHHATSCLDHSSGNRCPVELRGGGADGRQGVVAAV
jgi:hypothetical protein